MDLWDNESQDYSNPSGIDAPFKALFETNFIWADTNPNDEAAFGSTTLCGLLLKEIAQAHINSAEYQTFRDSFNQVFNSPASNLRQQIATIEQKVQRIFTEQFGQADIHFRFDELKIDSFFKNASIFIDDGVDIPMSEKGNGMQRSVALALLQVYAEELAHDEEQGQTKPFYLFIDEPELCLHPKGQTKLLEALLEISRTKQVFLTTHSPYFLVTPHLSNVGLFIFRKDGISNIVEDASLEPMFPLAQLGERLISRRINYLPWSYIMNYMGNYNMIVGNFEKKTLNNGYRVGIFSSLNNGYEKTMDPHKLHMT